MLYASASYGDKVVKWVGFASTFAGAALMAVFFWWEFLLSLPFLPDASSVLYAIPQFVFVFLFGFGAFILSWTLGLLAKTWRTSRESNRARLIAEDQQIAAQKTVVVEQERNRIARDMHDVVAHSLAVVIAQADGARYVRESDPSAVDGALETISATAREALGDVRILLGQLRHSQADAPQPVLADLDKLYDQLRSAGLSLRVEASGTLSPLPTGVQLAVYRIVQEALTNALRHGSGAGEATVNFTWLERELRIDVTNPIDAVGALGTDHEESAAEPSHGLAGMVERAMLVGGSLDAGPQDDRFVVTVTIPMTPSGEFA